MNPNDQKEIRAAIAKFITSYNSRDIQGIANGYSDSLLKFRNNSAPENKKDVLDRLTRMWSSKAAALSVTVDELIIDQKLAVASGTITITITPDATQQTIGIEQRRFLEIWRKESEQWVVFRTMDNNC